MAARASSPPPSSAYSFISYPTDYPSSNSYPSPPPHPLTAPPQEYSVHPPPYLPPHPHYIHLAHPHGPPSPLITSHLPPTPLSPMMHHPPSSPGGNGDTRVMRQLITAMAKMQTTMKDLAERQEQILDRMSLLEQRAGRLDDELGRVLEDTDAVVEDCRIIRRSIGDDENQGILEGRLKAVLDGAAERLVGDLGAEMSKVKRLVRKSEARRDDMDGRSGRARGEKRHEDAMGVVEEGHRVDI